MNAVGKSSLARDIQRAEPAIEVVHTTSAMMDWLGIKPGNYDALRSLPDDYKQQQNERMFQARLTTPPLDEHPLLFDSHYLNLVDGRVSRLIQGDWPKYLGGLVLIYADIEVVYDRIQRDAPARNRRLFPPGSTPRQQLDVLQTFARQTEAEFRAIADRFSLPSIAIQNSGNDATPLDDFLTFDYEIRRRHETLVSQ